MTTKNDVVRNIISIVIGTGLMAFAVACIYEPIGMITGGFTGIAIIIKHMSERIIPGGIPLGISTFILNLPIFTWAFCKRSRRFLIMTVLSTMMLSIWLEVLPKFEPVQGDYILSALLGGLLAGTGIGLVLRGKATTGGTDLLAVLLHSYFPHRSVVELLMVIDGIIVLFGLGVFGFKPALYGMIAIYMTTKVSDRLTEGIKFAKGALIMTSKPSEVSECIMKDMERGVTALSAKGMYTKSDKPLLYSVVSKKEIVQLQEIVYGLDAQAFVTVMDVREVLGEGFCNYSDEK